MEIKWWMLVGITVLFFVPYIRRVVYFPYLYLHEFGHSFMAFILGVERERMDFSIENGSGKVRVNWDTRNKVKVFLIASIGYAFPVIVVYLGILALGTKNTGAFFIGLMLVVVYGVLNTRSLVGWLILSAGAYVGGKLIYDGKWSGAMTHGITYFLVWFVGLGCLVTIRTLVLNYMRVAREENGDAWLLARELLLPVWFWTIGFVAVNGYAVYMLYGLLSGR